jgi:hypothetical protein
VAVNEEPELTDALVETRHPMPRVVSDSRPSPVERGVLSADGSLPFDRLQIEAWRRDVAA